MAAKEEILKLLEGLPYDVTFEDAAQRLIVLYRVKQCLEQFDTGGRYPTKMPRDAFGVAMALLET